MDDVTAILARHKPGDVVDVECHAGGIARGLKATLGDRPAGVAAQ